MGDSKLVQWGLGTEMNFLVFTVPILLQVSGPVAVPSQCDRVQYVHISGVGPCPLCTRRMARQITRYSRRSRKSGRNPHRPPPKTICPGYTRRFKRMELGWEGTDPYRKAVGSLARGERQSMSRRFRSFYSTTIIPFTTSSYENAVRAGRYHWLEARWILSSFLCVESVRYIPERRQSTCIILLAIKRIHEKFRTTIFITNCAIQVCGSTSLLLR